MAYTVYGIASRTDGHTGQREALETRAHQALRDALLGRPRTTVHALVAIRELLTGNAFGALHPEDLLALQAALGPLEQFTDARRAPSPPAA
jgi:hypothetical protein